MAIRHLFLLFIVCIAYADDQHLICKQVNDIFSDEIPQTSRRTAAIAQGRAGKRGIPGIKGERGDSGPPGTPAVVNYTQIQNVVLQNLASDSNALSEVVDALRSRLDVAEKMAAANCPVFYDGKCFRALLHDTSDVNFAAAQTMCQDIGWELANVYDATHYDMIRDYLRRKIPSSRNYNDAWLGMSISPRNKEIRYSFGREASDIGLQWFPGYPLSGPTYRNIDIYIMTDPASSRQGIYNDSPTSTTLGPICEI